METCWQNIVRDQYQIGSIVPKDYALELAESLDRDEISTDYIDNFCKKIIEKKENWSSRKSYDTVGARFGGAYKLKLSNKRAFKSWVFAKNLRTNGVYAWNPNTQERIFLTNFEFYCIFVEYRNAHINHMQISIIDGKANNLTPFNYPIYND